jgi:phage terminase small subunit
LANLEEAYRDYLSGMKYKDIAIKHGVTLAAVRQWKTRNNWQRKTSKISISSPEKNIQPKKKSSRKKGYTKNSKLRSNIEKDLIEQLNEKGAGHAHYIDMVKDYMSLWDVKNLLIEDINERGVVVTWNGNKKKNDSIGELNKTNAQMLKILSELDLKVEKKKGIKFGGETDDGDDGNFEDV